MTESSETLAAIDLGSNSFHMLVAKVDDSGKLVKIASVRESVRLGQGLTEEQTLTPESQKRALKCLGRFQLHLQGLAEDGIRVAGTNTLRCARNAESFIGDAQAVLGHQIEILSGHEEARLIYMGVANGHAHHDGKRLVIDIGGGSTELIVGTGPKVHVAESISMGCVSLSLSFFPLGGLDEGRFCQAIEWALKSTQPALSLISEQYNDCKHVVGCSGTIKAICRIAQSQGWIDEELTLEALMKLKDVMTQAGHVDELAFDGLKKSRKPVLAGGLCALIALFEALQIERMEVSKQALREGLLYDLVARRGTSPVIGEHF